jgi:RNA polymerase-interacting CarD/CdnL/TRCF family regulator
LIVQAHIESGGLFEAAMVIRDLVCFRQHERLTPYDRNSLQTVCNLLAFELMFIEEVPLELAKQLIKEDIELRLSGDETAFYRYE